MPYSFTNLLLSGIIANFNFNPYKPTEWQYDKYSDSSILPGDDFYRFVCGKGIAAKGSDSWAPFYRWGEQEDDFLDLASNEGKDNPVPVLKRLFELKAAATSEKPEHIAEAFVRMRERLDGIEKRAKGWEFPEKAAEYCRNGYALLYVCPMFLGGRKLGFYATAPYEGMLKDWTDEQLKMTGIKEKYLSDNITEDEESILNLDASIPEECRHLKDYRVNGIVNNIDDWYQLFDVSSERKFYLSPERRVHLW